MEGELYAAREKVHAVVTAIFRLKGGLSKESTISRLSLKCITRLASQPLVPRTSGLRPQACLRIEAGTTCERAGADDSRGNVGV